MLAASAVAAVLAVAGCGAPATNTSSGAHPPRAVGATGSTTTGGTAAAAAPGPLRLLPGMPPVTDPSNIYAADRAGALSPTVAGFRPLLYVPNSGESSIDELDPGTHQIVRRIQVGLNPQHVVPSYDLKTLWVLNDLSNSVTALDPRNGRPGRTIVVADPYNLYFTPDGRFALVVEEARETLAFRNPRTMALVHALPVRCPGIDHMDFTADGRYLIASCEFSRQLVKVDVARQKVVGYLPLGRNTSPQDVKTAPNGKRMYVADRYRGGVWTINPNTFSITSFTATGGDAHGLYVGRDARYLYVTNRSSGSVSLISFATGRVEKTWPIPGGTPDMGGFTVDGKVLWLSGRYRSDIYALDSTSGRLLARIRVGSQPHGIAIYPQPGRYSLGHTGVFR